MVKLARWALATVVALLGVIVGPVCSAAACVCIPRTPAQQFAEASAVFTVKIVSARTEGDEWVASGVVSDVYKGQVALLVRVTSPTNDCGIKLRPGQVTLLHVSGPGPENFETSICASTVWNAADLSAEQRAGRTDPVARSSQPRPAPAQGPWWRRALPGVAYGGAAVVAIGLLTLALARRRR